MRPIETLLSKLAAAGIEAPPGRLRADGYGDSPELSAELIDLIHNGPKRAGTGLLQALEHDGEPMPAVGDIEIVVDHRRKPVLLTRMTRVEVIRFNGVDATYPDIEGEGDGTLEHWRRPLALLLARMRPRRARAGRTHPGGVLGVRTAGLRAPRRG